MRTPIFLTKFLTFVANTILIGYIIGTFAAASFNPLSWYLFQPEDEPTGIRITLTALVTFIGFIFALTEQNRNDQQGRK